MKQSEIINLSAAELQEKLSQLRKVYADLKTAHTISPIANPLQIRSGFAIGEIACAFLKSA